MSEVFVLLHHRVYYLYGTYDPMPNSGVRVYISEDLVHWQDKGWALANSNRTWAQHHFWGAEVLFHHGAFYMYFNASPNKTPDLPFNVSLCIAVGDSPLGPFKELKTPFYDPPGPDEAIHQHIFIDDDRQAYLYLTYVTYGRNEIRVVKLKENLIEFDGEPILCLRPTEPWESHPIPGTSHLVAEGANVIKHKGYYYLTYAANVFYSADYAMCYATSKNPMGPWTKAKNNPILKSSEYIYGPGGGTTKSSPDGSEMFMLYSVHNNLSGWRPRRLAIDRIRFIPQQESPDLRTVDGPTHTPQSLPSGAKSRVYEEK